nr:retrovirus-related Pol polyprotein from transposon TNT 1-94 [Tanacetum cinerariifolium]
ADSLLPIPFWAEAVNTACYVQNRVLVNKPHNKTPYELLHGRLPSIGFMRPFGCPVTILNTLDPLGKFQGKVDEGFLVGYSVCSKAFRSVSPDIHSSSCGDQAREQGDKAMNKDKVSAAGLDFTNNINDFTAAGPLVSAAELNFTNSTNDFSANGP